METRGELGPYRARAHRGDRDAGAAALLAIDIDSDVTSALVDPWVARVGVAWNPPGDDTLMTLPRSAERASCADTGRDTTVDRVEHPP